MLTLKAARRPKRKVTQESTEDSRTLAASKIDIDRIDMDRLDNIDNDRFILI